MKVAIIGAGWIGSHLAYKLKDNHDVTLFDSAGVFSGSSFYNQNRLHNGFHYSRNQKTRLLCRDTFGKFITDYPFLVDDIPNNLYCIPRDTSLIDYGTFKSIFTFEDISFAEIEFDAFNGIEGTIIANEKFINPRKAKEFFQRELANIISIENITESRLYELSKEYDIVINATNNALVPIDNHYFELSITLIYNKLKELPFGSITLVDGPLFSIYPYDNNQYTVTDVERTPLFTSKELSDIKSFRSNILTDSLISETKSVIERKILKYFPDFNSYFDYDSYYTSIKVKKFSESADRYPSIDTNGNIVSIVTGKIQGIYVIENYLQNEVINR